MGVEQVTSLQHACDERGPSFALRRARGVAMPGSNTTIIPHIVRFPESTLIVHDLPISDGLVRQIRRSALALSVAGAEVQVDCRGRPHGCSAEARARVGRIVFRACAESPRADLAVRLALDRLSERIRAPRARDLWC